MVSVFEIVPGLNSLFNRYFADGNDAGIIFSPSDFFTFKGVDSSGSGTEGGQSAGTAWEYRLQLPTLVGIAARKKVVIKEVSGLSDPIKYVTPSTVTDISISGFAGNFRSFVIPSVPVIPIANPIIQQGVGLANLLLGTNEYTSKLEILKMIFAIHKKADRPIQIEDSEGFLAAHGITAGVPYRLREDQAGRLVAWTMQLYGDDDENPVDVLFPEESEQA